MNRSQLPEMPACLKELYENLCQEVTWVHVVWNQYRHLFGTSEERFNLLKEMAPGFFRVCHDALLDDVVLTLCRMTDEEKVCGKENMVLDRVANVASALGDAEMTATLQNLAKEAKDRCAVLREHRHKRLAHADLQVFVHKSQLSGFNRDTIEKALECVRNFTNTIGLHYTGVGTDFQTPALFGEADSLVYLIKEAKAYRKHQIAGRVNPYEDGLR